MTPEMSDADVLRVRVGIKEKYDRVAAEGCGCCFRYPTGKEGMIFQGYPLDLIQNLPEEIPAAYCGVGNPFSLAPLYAGDTVLDIGCGAGVDSLVAAQMVGPSGQVIGIDLTAAMLERARANLARLGWPQVSFKEGDAEALPFPDSEFDVVISNGVFNLATNKAKALEEAHRVLKPGGRLMLADMILVAALPPDQSDKVENWFQ